MSRHQSATCTGIPEFQSSAGGKMAVPDPGLSLTCEDGPVPGAHPVGRFRHALR